MWFGLYEELVSNDLTSKDVVIIEIVRILIYVLFSPY